MKKLFYSLLFIALAGFSSTIKPWTYTIFNATEQEIRVQLWEWAFWKTYMTTRPNTQLTTTNRTGSFMGTGTIQPFQDLKIKPEEALKAGFCLGAILIQFPHHPNASKRNQWYIAKLSRVTTANQEQLKGSLAKMGVSIEGAGEKIAVNLASTANVPALIASGVIGATSLAIGKGLQFLPSIFEKTTCKSITFTVMNFVNDQTGEEWPFALWW